MPALEQRPPPGGLIPVSRGPTGLANAWIAKGWPANAWAAQGWGRLRSACRRLPPLRGGALRCSQHRLARRNSLRSLRELRSDSRRENDGRCALRAPPVLLRFSAAHRHADRRRPHPWAAHAFAVTAVAFVSNGLACALQAPLSTRLPERQSAAGRASASRRAACGVAQAGCAAFGTPMSAAPSSAAPGSAREARFVLLTCGAVSERSERSERSELRRTTPGRAAQGSRCAAPTAAVSGVPKAAQPACATPHAARRLAEARPAADCRDATRDRRFSRRRPAVRRPCRCVPR